MRATEFTIESDIYQPPKLSVGDTILKGKFKNSKAEIKGFTKDKHNQPVLKTNKGEVQLFKPRITKLMQEDVSPILDPAGWGNTPKGTDIDYFGLKVKMRPSMFLKLAHPLTPGDENPDVETHMSTGGKIAYPWIDIREPQDWNKGKFEDFAKVIGHEGRNRMKAWIKIKGDDPIQVNLFLTNANRRKNINDNIIAALSQGLYNEKGKLTNGPIFDPNTALEETEVSGTGSSPHSWTGDELYRKLVELEDIDEGWKDWAAAATIGAAALAPQFGSKPIEPTVKPAITQPAQAAPQKKQMIAAPSKNPQIESIVSNAAKKAGMKGAELAQFMAQVKHESWDFSRLKEKGQPYVKDYFKKKYDPKSAPKTAKILGNIHKGDGDKYKGRGFIQLTGRDNYRMAGNALNLPLLVKPELASNPEVAAKIAIWYWNTRVKPYVNNFNDTAAVTKKINSSMHGLESREANFMAYLEKKVIGKPA